MNNVVWDMDPVLIKLGPIAVHWYGVCFALAITSGYYIMSCIFKKEKLDREHLDPLLYFLIVGIIIGARLGHCLFYEPEYYLAEPWKILKVWEGGLASHGGIAGILIALFFFCKKYPQYRFLNLLDKCALSSMLGAGLIRIGNFFNSEIVGNPTDSIFGITFVRDKLHTTVPRHPAQLYEAICYFAVFTVLLLIYRRKKRQKDGFYVGLLFTLVFTGRFTIEFFKTSQAAFDTSFLRMGQWLSIPFVIAGIILMRRK